MDDSVASTENVNAYERELIMKMDKEKHSKDQEIASFQEIL